MTNYLKMRTDTGFQMGPAGRAPGNRPLLQLQLLLFKFRHKSGISHVENPILGNLIES